MDTFSLHKRLRDLRDGAIRRPKLRPVYSHAVTSAHMNDHLVADDHPSWPRIWSAIEAARDRDGATQNTIERELLRLFPDRIGPAFSKPDPAL